MLENLIFTGRELLLAVVLASLVYVLEVWLFSRWRGGRNGAAQDTAARMRDMQAQIDALAQRLEGLEAQPPAGSLHDSQAVLQAEAVRMAREGASARELVEKLGISLTEADLILALHRPDA